LISTPQREKELSFGVFGDIETNKNVDVILEAFSKLIQYKYRWKVHIAGSVGDESFAEPPLNGLKIP